MNHDKRVNLSDEPLPELAVLARLPRVGGSAAIQATPPLASRSQQAFGREASDDASPLLVVVEDEAAANPRPFSPGPSDDAPGEPAAVEALAAIAKPSPSSAVSRLSSPSFEREEDDAQEAEGTRIAGSVFRLHEWIAPYSSVVVTIALVAVAGLLFFVAFQPPASTEHVDSTWAEDAGVAAPWSPVEQAAPESQLVATPESKSRVHSAAAPTADFSKDDVRDLAPEIPDSFATADPSETTPTELPHVVLESPQPYPSTGSPAFEQALVPTAEKKQ